MTTVNEDIDTLASEPVPIILTTGMHVEISRLKTRQLMRALKILTRGSGDALTSLNFSGEDQDAFAGQLIGAIAFSIPEAEDETIDFIRSMVLPVGLIPNPKNKEDEAKNLELLDDLDNALINPELDDLLDIIEQIVNAEAPHVLALGKRLALLLKIQTASATAKQGGSTRKGSKA